MIGYREVVQCKICKKVYQNIYKTPQYCRKCGGELKIYQRALFAHYENPLTKNAMRAVAKWTLFGGWKLKSMESEERQ